MGLTDFDTPPRKLTLTAIGAVVGLHVLAAMALTMVKTPDPVVEVTETPPIEIQMVTLPVEAMEPESIEPEVVEVKAIAEPVSTPKPAIKPKPEAVKENPPPKPAVPDLKPQSKPQPKPPADKNPQPVAKTTPPVKEPVESAPSESAPKIPTPKPNTQPEPSIVVEKEPFRHEVKRQESVSTIQADALAADNERKLLAAQAEKAAQETHAKAMRDAQAAADVKAAKAAEQAAQQKAQAAATAKAQAAAAAASNTPVNFTASNANWAAAPNFSFPSRAKRGASSGDSFNVVLVLRVNKQGGIDSVRIAQSSGNAVLDKEAQRQVRSGKFKPFMKDGVPVVGNVTLPISYAVP